MSAHDVPLLWCFLQVTLLSALGIGAAWLLVRRAPAGGAIAATAAAVAIAAVTLLAPVSLPKLPNWRGKSLQSRGPASSVATDVDAESAASGEGFSFDLSVMAKRTLFRPGVARLVEPLSGPRVEWFVGIFATAGATVGLLRLLQSLRFVSRIRRNLTPIADDEAARLFVGLSQSLNVRCPVELCESPLVASPAVVGWRRPIVLLPVEQAQWTEQQLRATLAHELAHVVRNDYFWRCVGIITLAVHFFHPLVHLLARRLTLLQEIATDRLAATAFGESTRYLQALS